MTDDDENVGPVNPRSIEVIFEDLRNLARSSGALHYLSYFFFRDWVLTIDRHNARVTDAPEHRWSTKKLNKNELMLLLGLIIQSPSSQIYTALPTDRNCADQIDALFGELHNRLTVPGKTTS